MDALDIDRLIAKVASGDTASLEILYNRFAKSVYALAYSIVSNHAAAEDIMQDTFVKVWSAAASFKSKGFGKAWIMRIARNLSLNYVTRCRTQSMDEMNEESGERFASEQSLEDRTVASVAVEYAMSRLSENEKQIVTLHGLCDMTLSEIAEMLGEPLGTIKWRHSEAMKKMRKELQEYQEKQVIIHE